MTLTGDGKGDRAEARRRGIGVRAATGAVVLGTSALLAACGGGVILQDDLAVTRTGDVPGAKLTLVVNDSGTVSCNGHNPVPISDPQLIQARYLSGALQPQASAKESLPPGPRPVFHYVVQTPDGRVSFSDDSPHVPSLFSQVALLTLQIAQSDCKLAL